MMHSAYDPRDDIRETIGTSIYNFELKQTNYVAQIVGSDLRTINVPIYDEEEIKSGELPTLPFISLKLAYNINEPHNVGASVRKFIAYVDIDVAYAATENIDIKDFGKDIKDWLHNQIRTYQATTDDVFFMNIEEERYISETLGRQVIFHYILTLKAQHQDAC
jgi:hypothetical protein